MNLNDLIEVKKDVFINKIDKYLLYQRDKIKACIEDWKYFDDYNNYDEYFNDIKAGEITDGEEPLDIDTLIGMPKVIGDFLIKYAQTLKIRHEALNNEFIEKYYITKKEDIDNESFGFSKKGDNKISRIQELENTLTSKPIKKTSNESLYI